MLSRPIVGHQRLPIPFFCRSIVQQQHVRLVSNPALKPPIRPTRAVAEQESALSKLPIQALLRSVFLTTIMSSSWLLRPSLGFLGRITQSESSLLNADKNPILNRLFRWTIYDHFCAGADVAQVSRTVKAIKKLGYHGIILGYSKEIVLDPNEAASPTGVEDEYGPQYYRVIDKWKRGNLDTLEMVEPGDLLALKLTGAGPIAVDAMQAGRPMPPYLEDALDEICNETRDKGCQLWIDAEQQALQTTVDEWTIALMRKHNRHRQALIYNTIQAYLKGARANAERHITLAAQEGWVVGIKLVRGAYIENEVRSLIHDTKEDTDRSYDDIANMMISQLLSKGLESLNLEFPDAALFLATHNAASAEKALHNFRERVETGRPAISMKCAQIMGMADELSCRLLQDYEKTTAAAKGPAMTPRIYKCLPWGSVAECVGYLYRRAVENRGAVERTQHMADAMRQELGRRMFGWK